MLYDREYMRGSDGAWWRSPVYLLMIVLGALFLVECVLRVYGQGNTLSTWFGLSLPTFQRHEYWRLLTYSFLHDAPWPWHLLFNGLALWFFGRPLLEALGTARFWQIYLLAGFLGGLLEVVNQTIHQPMLTVGASACVLGLAGAFCLLHPEQELTFFFYVIPIRMRSMTMFWILFGFSAFGTVFPYGNVAHAAHLGGLLTGALFVRVLVREDFRLWLGGLRGRRAPWQRPQPVPAGKHDDATAPVKKGSPEPETSEDFIRREVDPILDKISAHGIQSLTERERRILEKARERMRNR